MNYDYGMDLVLKAGVAHLWFVTIHPFEDGNYYSNRRNGKLILLCMRRISPLISADDANRLIFMRLWLRLSHPVLAPVQRWATGGGMANLLKLLGGFRARLVRSHAAREAEIAFLRGELLVATRSAPTRLRLRSADRLVFVCLYRLYPALLRAAIIFKPETLPRWPRSEIWSAQSSATSRVPVRGVQGPMPLAFSSTSLHPPQFDK
jgi:hypothetical protein